MSIYTYTFNFSDGSSLCVCGGGGGGGRGGTIDLYPHPAPAGVWGSGCKHLNRGLGKRTTSQRVYGKLFHYIHVSLLVPIVPQDKAYYIEV